MKAAIFWAEQVNDDLVALLPSQRAVDDDHCSYFESVLVNVFNA